MINLESALVAAKPVVPDLPEDFSQRVMTEVFGTDPHFRSEELQKYQIKGIPLLFGVLFFLVSFITVNSILFEIKMSGSIELLYYGTHFLGDILEYIPFDLIVFAAVITAASSWLMWFSRIFKKGIASVIIVVYLMSSIGGSALAASGINEQIQKTLLTTQNNMPLVSWLYEDRARYHVKHPNFRVGRVEKIEDGFVWLIDPHGEKIKAKLPIGMKTRNGQIISLVGSETDSFFKSSNGRHCDPERADIYFSHMSMMHRKMKGNMKNHHQSHHTSDKI